jgi:hypothetical protein
MKKIIEKLEQLKSLLDKAYYQSLLYDGVNNTLFKEKIDKLSEAIVKLKKQEET